MSQITDTDQKDKKSKRNTFRRNVKNMPFALEVVCYFSAYNHGFRRV